MGDPSPADSAAPAPSPRPPVLRPPVRRILGQEVPLLPPDADSLLDHWKSVAPELVPLYWAEYDRLAPLGAKLIMEWGGTPDLLHHMEQKGLSPASFLVGTRTPADGLSPETPFVGAPRPYHLKQLGVPSPCPAAASQESVGAFLNEALAQGATVPRALSAEETAHFLHTTIGFVMGSHSLGKISMIRGSEGCSWK